MIALIYWIHGSVFGYLVIVHCHGHDVGEIWCSKLLKYFFDLLA
jgi:hypothetical protein